MYSLILDGGISYLLLRSLRNLFRSKTPQKDPYTEGYQKAVQDMQQWQRTMQVPRQTFTPAQEDEPQQQHRGYEKGRSR
jgi:hypothetical protein